MTYIRLAPEIVGFFNGQPVHQVTIGRPDALQATILTWGAVIQDLSLPLESGGRQPLTLGFDRFEPYPEHSPYFGAVVGRYANRISGGSFSLAGQTYKLDCNEAGKTTLHGGSEGFDRRIWQIADHSDDSITLCLISPHGDQGFPGTVNVTCTYAITSGVRLDVQFKAQSDQPTPLNLAQHAYFNLDGGPDISNHILQIFANEYTPVGPNQIPTGEIKSVAGRHVDFRQPKHLRQTPHAFDHNFILSEPLSKSDGLRAAARLTSQKSGISMLIQTTKPGLQFYDGHHLNVPVTGHSGRYYGQKAGLCLETQFYPDSPNQSSFPASILYPDQTYSHQTVLSFER
jgi:aldose 1-epimerase